MTTKKDDFLTNNTFTIKSVICRKIKLNYDVVFMHVYIVLKVFKKQWSKRQFSHEKMQLAFKIP